LTVLVTGATGVVGSAVVRRLVAEGFDVRAMVRATSNRTNLEGLVVEVVEGDLNDRASLHDAVRGCEGVFHVAADYRLWVRDPADMFRTNVKGTQEIMGAAAAGEGLCESSIQAALQHLAFLLVEALAMNGRRSRRTI